jgi:hypothetical protein
MARVTAAAGLGIRRHDSQGEQDQGDLRHQLHQILRWLRLGTENYCTGRKACGQSTQTSQSPQFSSLYIREEHLDCGDESPLSSAKKAAMNRRSPKRTG